MRKYIERKREREREREKEREREREREAKRNYRQDVASGYCSIFMENVQFIPYT